MNSLRAALDDRLTFNDGESRTTTTRRSLKAAEFWSQYLTAMATDPNAVWDDSIQAIRSRAIVLDLPSLLELESPTLRQLRRDLESSF